LNGINKEEWQDRHHRGGSACHIEIVLAFGLSLLFDR